MKEIVNICSSFMPADNIGGPAFCGFDLLNQIDKIGYSKIISFDQGINKKIWDINYYEKQNIFYSTQHYFCPSNFLGYIFLIKKTIDYILNKNSSVFILHGVYNIPYVLVSLIFIFLKVKLYIIPHGTLNRDRVKISKNFLVKNFAYIFLKFIHYKSIFVFSNQEEYKASLLFKNKHIFNRNYFIPNILKTESLNYYLNKLPKSINRKSKKNLKEDNLKNKKIFNFLESPYRNSLSLIYFGRISKEKGIDIFLRSLKGILSVNNLIPNIHLHFIGDGNQEYLNLIKEIISDHRIKISFTFYGWLPRDQAMDLIKRINGIMIFPSISDNFNLSFLESILLGKKAIVSNTIATSNDEWLSNRIFKLDLNKLDISLKRIINEISDLFRKKELFYEEEIKFNHPYSELSVKNRWQELIYKKY